MKNKRIVDAIKTGKTLVSDGAWGTFLQNMGLKPGECPELWCSTHPDNVTSIARQYIEAGADMVESNSFGGSRFKLKHYNLEDRTSEINEAAARCEIICTYTFEKTKNNEYRTMMGTTVEQTVLSSIEAGADIVGTNCGNGFQNMIDIVKEIRAVDAQIPILVHANAGLPRQVDGKDTFPETPDDMARRVPALIEAGANIVGGCCGTTPEHISAIKKAV